MQRPAVRRQALSPMNEDKPSNRTARPRWGRRALLILVPLLLAGAWYGRSAFIGERDPTTNYQFTTVQRGDVEEHASTGSRLTPPCRSPTASRGLETSLCARR